MAAVWLLPAVLLLAGVALATDYRAIDYGPDDGLEVEFTKGTAEDSLGILWIATDDGLYRYDGIHFLNLQQGLPSLYVKSFFEDAERTLFAVTDLGIVRIDGTPLAPTVEPFIPGSATMTDSTVYYPKMALMDATGDAWISEQTAVVRWHQGRLTRFPFPEKAFSYDFLRSFSLFTTDADRDLWAVSISGYLYRFDREQDAFVEVPLPGTRSSVAAALPLDDSTVLLGGIEGLAVLTLPRAGHSAKLHHTRQGISVSSLARGASGEIFVGTWTQGAFVTHDTSLAELENIRDFRYSKVNHLSYANHNLWLSTDTGVTLVQSTPFNAIRREGMSTYIHDIEEAPSGQLYFCDGSRIMALRNEYTQARLDTIFQGFQNTILQFQFLRGAMYVSTSKGEVFEVRGGNRVVSTLELENKGRPILFMMADREGALWMTQTDVPGVTRIRANHAIDHFTAESGLPWQGGVIGETARGLLVASAHADSLFLDRFDPETGRFLPDARSAVPAGETVLEVNDLREGLNGEVYVGTTHGLMVLRAEGLVVYPLPGGSEVDVRSVGVDPDSALWLGTQHGLYRIVRDQTILFTQADGLPARNVSRHCIRFDSYGRIWVGTSLGAAWARGVPEVRKTPRPILVSVQRERASVFTDGRLHLTPRSVVELDFAAPSFPGREVLYQTRLVHTGEEMWSRAGNEHGTYLHHLPLGPSVWQVRARHQGNYAWSDPLEIPLRVEANWYTTWWAFLLYILLALGVYAFAVVARTRKLVREKARLEQVVADRTRQALAQLERSKNAEIEAKQMRTANRMAGTIAHEFNNPLAVIQGNLDIIRLHKRNELDQQTLERIQAQIDRMSGLVKKLLKIQDLKEMDYAAGMKILNIHSLEDEVESEPDKNKL